MNPASFPHERTNAGNPADPGCVFCKVYKKRRFYLAESLVQTFIHVYTLISNEIAFQHDDITKCYGLCLGDNQLTLYI